MPIVLPNVTNYRDTLTKINVQRQKPPLGTLWGVTVTAALRVPR